MRRRFVNRKVDLDQKQVKRAFNALWSGRLILVVYFVFTIGLVAFWLSGETTIREVLWPIALFGGISYFGLRSARYAKQRLSELADRETKNRKAGIIP